MKIDIKNNDNCARQAYVPASVKVIEVTAQRVLCESGLTGTERSGDHLE